MKNVIIKFDDPGTFLGYCPYNDVYILKRSYVDDPSSSYLTLYLHGRMFPNTSINCNALNKPDYIFEKETNIDKNLSLQEKQDIISFINQARDTIKHQHKDDKAKELISKLQTMWNMNESSSEENNPNVKF